MTIQNFCKIVNQKNTIFLNFLMKEQLIKLLEKLKLTQKEFAKQLGVSSSTVTEVIQGRTKSFNYEVLVKIKELYNVNLTWLLTGEGEMFLPDVTQQSTSKQFTDPRIQRIYYLLKEHPELIDMFEKLLKGTITLREIMQEISSMPPKKQQAILVYIQSIKNL